MIHYTQADSDKYPREGGYAFQFDGPTGMWLSQRFVRERSGIVEWDMGNAWGGNFIHGIVSYSSKQLNDPPESASPLWDKPETVTEDIIAYRAWEYTTRIQEDGSVAVLLQSLHQCYTWDGPVTTSDKPPASGTEHGLYALGLFPHHRGNFSTYISDGDGEVWGRVALSGLVVEGTAGYRAERATIQELWVNPDEFDDQTDSIAGLCKSLGDRYQCDVSVRVPNWEDLTK